MTVHSAGGPAARAFATDIAGWERHDDEQLEIMLFSVGAFIEKAGTGGGLFRRLLAQGAFEIAQMTGDEATTSLARSANRAAEAWTTVARWPPPGIGPHVVESATPRSRPWPFRSSRPS